MIVVWVGGQILDARAAMRDMKKGIFRPIYIGYGQETYLMDQFVNFAIQHCMDSSLVDLALSKVDLRETPLATVLEDAETAPFMVPKKLIVAENALFFTGTKEKSKVEHDLDRLVNYIQSPSEDTILIFLVQADKLDERKKVVKSLKKMDALVPFRPMDTPELVKWVMKEASNRGVHITEAAADRLLFNTGASLQKISSELEKCCLYAGKDGEITVEAVDQLVARTVEQNVFLLIENIVHRKHDQAMALLHQLLQQREEPIKIVALIARQFRMVLQTKMLGDQGFSHQQMGSKLGLHPYAAKLAYEQSRHYQEMQLANILDEVAELDFQIKSGRMEKVMGLELLLLKLAG